MEPFGAMIGDVPAKFRKQTVDIIPTSTFKDNSYNHGMTRAGTGLIFVSAVSFVDEAIFWGLGMVGGGGTGGESVMLSTIEYDASIVLMRGCACVSREIRFVHKASRLT